MENELGVLLFDRIGKRIRLTHSTNPILKQEKVSLTDIIKNQFITADRDIGYCALLERELRKLSIEMEPVMEMVSVGAIVNVMLGGYGASYIPRFMAEKYLDSGELTELKTEEIDINVYSYYMCNR